MLTNAEAPGAAEAPDELDQIEASSPENDPAIQALRQTDPESAYKLEIAALRAQNVKLIGRQRAAVVNTYRDQLLAQEFPLAPAEAVTGSTKAEVRRNAERAHNGTLAVLKNLGLTPEQIAATIATRNGTAAGAPAATAPAGGRATATPPADPRQAQWGAPPPPASEAVAGEQLPDWEDMKRDGLSGKTDRASILADLRKNGARRVEQPTFAMAARRMTGADQGTGA